MPSSKALFTAGLLVLLAGPVYAREGAVCQINYLYIDANTGGSSGGHTALQINDRVYHYQKLTDGSFRLQRDPFSRFLFIYTRLNNRNLWSVELSTDCRKAGQVEFRINNDRIRQQLDADQYERAKTLNEIMQSVEMHSGNYRLKLPYAGYFQSIPVADTGGKLPRIHKLYALLARQVLEEPGSLSNSAFFELPYHLSPAESRFFAGYSVRLKNEAERLLGTDKEHYSQAALLTALRSVAAKKSAEKNRPVFLNTISEDRFAETETLSTEQSEAAQLMLVYAKDSFHRDLKHFTGPENKFSGFYLSVEQSALDLLRLYSLTSESVYRPVRIEYKKGFVRFRTDLTKQQIQSAAGLAEQRLNQIHSGLVSKHSYSLISNNCVTRLAKFTELSTGQNAPGFIPYLSALRISEKKDGSQRRIQLYRSYRNEKLHAAGLQDSMSEDFVPLSSVYESKKRDGYFLFFTGRRKILRMPYGLVNLLAGLGETVYGISTADRDRIKSGGDSAFYSLPEIFFFNIRKGTYRYGDDLFYRKPVPVATDGIQLN